MALTRVSLPNPAPIDGADYTAILAQIASLAKAFTDQEVVNGSTIKSGAVILVGGILYLSGTDTTITGTPSNYVKITPAGASALASFVASLSGVTWNPDHGGYYDGGAPDSLYIFDEALAYQAGAVTELHTQKGKISYIATTLTISGKLVPTIFPPDKSETTTGGSVSRTLPIIDTVGGMLFFAHSYNNTGSDSEGFDVFLSSTGTYDWFVDVAYTEAYLIGSDLFYRTTNENGAGSGAGGGVVVSKVIAGNSSVSASGYIKRTS